MKFYRVVVVYTDINGKKVKDRFESYESRQAAFKVSEFQKAGPGYIDSWVEVCKPKWKKVKR